MQTGENEVMIRKQGDMVSKQMQQSIHRFSTTSTETQKPHRSYPFCANTGSGYITYQKYVTDFY